MRPLHVATFQGHGAAAWILLAAGADRVRSTINAMTIAGVRDDVPTLKALLSAGASTKLVTSVYDGAVLTAFTHLGSSRDG